MKKHHYLLFLILSLSACDNTTQPIKKSFQLALVPQPKEITLPQEGLLLSNASQVHSPNEKVQPLLQLLVKDLKNLTKVALKISSTQNSKADIIFEIDSSLKKEEYQIAVTETIQIKGGSYQALAFAKSTFLQLIEQEEQNLVFPKVMIKDSPDAEYRGLLVDLARQWHSMETVKKLIDLSAYYKVNYLQLHFTDHQSYTLPSKKYPKLATQGRHYSWEDLKEMEAYSQARGVTIIPEIDVPGHSQQFVIKYPEIFAIQDTATNPYIINMGKEEVYVALETIIEEVLDVFKTTPYLHIGGDEAYLAKVNEDPNVQAFKKKHEIGEDVHELYRYFLVRLNEMVKKQNKVMCIWEGFTKEGEIQIPKDIIVFEFETNRYLPDQLIADGYTVVNTSWKPLYVVNKKKWEPQTIYNWNIWRWENWWSRAPSIVPIQLEKTPLIIGAQMCSWEQAEKVEIPSIRKRLPVMMERIWNTEQQIPFDQFYKQLKQADQRLSSIIDDNRQDSLLVGHNWVEEMQ